MTKILFARKVPETCQVLGGPGFFYPKLQIPDPGFQVLIPGSWPFDLRSQVLCFELQDLGVRQFSNYIKVPQLLQSLVVITTWDRKLLQCDRYCKLRHILQSEMKPMITKINVTNRPWTFYITPLELLVKAKYPQF